MWPLESHPRSASSSFYVNCMYLQLICSVVQQQNCILLCVLSLIVLGYEQDYMNSDPTLKFLCSGLRYSGMWLWVTGLMVRDLSWCNVFVFMGGRAQEVLNPWRSRDCFPSKREETHQATHHHFPEDLRPQLHHCVNFVLLQLLSLRSVPIYKAQPVRQDSEDL
jgi:hypothetical protein